MHPLRRRCSSFKYSRYSQSSRLARGAPRPSRCDARLAPRAASHCRCRTPGNVARRTGRIWPDAQRFAASHSRRWAAGVPDRHQPVRRVGAKAVDSARVVTISSTESHLVSANGQIDENRAHTLRGEVGTDAESVAVDVLAPHFPRTEDWASATAARIRAVRAAMDRAGSHVPIYLNEERRADPPARIAPDAYRVACS